MNCTTTPEKPTKAITQVLDGAVLPQDLATLIPWLKERTFCTLYDAFCAMMPAGLRHEMQLLYCALHTDDTPPLELLSEEELSIVNALRRARKPFTAHENLLKKCGLPKDSTLPEQLCEKGYIIKQTDAVGMAGSRPLNMDADDNSPSAKDISLTPAQQTAFENLRKPKQSTALLFGVTGSGKTSVYLKLIDETLAQNKTALVLVPEISLTPQMLGIFQARYGNKVALLHSARSIGERTQAWQRIQSGQASVVIGTRSAIFAPLSNIGLIVLDEEHEHTYKSEQSPRYHARDVAKVRAKQHGALLLLSSATPSVESYAHALSGRYQLETLPARYGNANLPEVRTIDLLSQENLLSMELLAALKEHIDAGHQAILLMNRRGFSTFLACTSCKQVVNCPQCSISLNYHLAGQRMLCHYCGHSTPAPEHCPSCNKLTIRFGGAGTQKLEEELARLLPDARVARMDADSTSQKHAREEILSRFASHEYDILLGTQMVAKGLDFENVTLVGVINIDQQLYFDDFRALERSFALLTQVAGRAGRGQHPGLALIQTINPFNEVIMQAAKQDYPAFFDGEVRMRKLMTYPPYCDICLLGVVGENEQTVKTGAKFLLELVRTLGRDEKLIVLGPMPARVSRVNKKYRWRLLIKCRNSASLRTMVAETLVQFGKDARFSEATAYADINPEGI